MKFLDSCSNEEKYTDYRGTLSTTKNGYTCQKWTEQTPHVHSTTREDYPDGGLGDHNYCRNPDDEESVWCYTTDPGKWYDYCYVPSCSVDGEL